MVYYYKPIQVMTNRMGTSYLWKECTKEEQEALPNFSASLVKKRDMGDDRIHMYFDVADIMGESE